MSLGKKVLIPSLLVALSTAASAQATRTWISGVGDDANPCSRTAPCKTFAGAISKTAAGGEIDALDPGGFGGITITKAITLDGGGLVSSVLVAGTTGVTIAAGTGDVVTLRNLSLNGMGTGGSTSPNGVNIVQAGNVHLENVAIFGFTNGVSVAPNGATSVTLDRVVSRDNTGAALTIVGASSSSLVQVSVKNSSFLNSPVGVSVGANSKALISDSTASTNSGAGYSVSANGILTTTDSTATANSGAGYKVDSTGGNPTLTLVRSTAVTNAGAGIQTSGAGTSVVRITGSALLSNGGGITAAGTTLVGTYGDNEITNGITGVTLTPLAKQ